MRQAIHLSFSPICLSDHFCWSLAKRGGKWREEAKRMIESKNDSCVVSLNSRFILVLLLWLRLFRGEKKKGGRQVNRLAILSSYLVAKVKSASKRAMDEKSFNKMQHLEGFPILLTCSRRAWNIAFSAIKHAHEETTKQDETGEINHLVTYLLNKCNTGVYLWQDWRAGIMNGFSKVI